jgi:hypothetical protein
VQPYRIDEFEIFRDEEYEFDPHCTKESGKWKFTAAMVVINDFFTNGRALAYYIIGRYNIEAFTLGTFGMPAYNGPLNAAVMVTHNFNPIAPDAWDDAEKHRVRIYHSPLEKVKWRYLFETGRVAWSKMLINPRKVERLRADQDKMIRRIQKSARKAAVD